jgi:hypothetical protein
VYEREYGANAFDLHHYPTLVKKGHEILRKHVSCATAHEVREDHAEVLPTGENTAPVIMRSIATLQPGAKADASVNNFLNGKSCFVGYKPRPWALNAATQVVGSFLAPTVANGSTGDSYNPFNATYFTEIGTMGIQTLGATASNQYTRLRSRGVYSHYTVSYTGPLQTCQGSAYIWFPPHDAYQTTVSTDNSFSFNSVFGDQDMGLAAFTNNSAANSNRTKIITLAKLAELGQISFVVYNELKVDQVLVKPTDTIYDNLDEVTNTTSGGVAISRIPNFVIWFDSQTLADRVRICHTQQFDVEYNDGALFGGINPKTDPHHPHPHIWTIPTTINAISRNIGLSPNMAQQRQELATANVDHMYGKGQPMDRRTLSKEQEMDVGHPSFSNLPKAYEAFKNTEVRDNEIAAPFTEVAPEIAAPFVEPFIAIHSLWNAFEANETS